mmetsp:Transcript_16853/g.30054  ORF Transcript_16853/g.30054 Transcript_16853/m.30054 type:complete len:361 (-) Transcript_16853:116-1198(-)|eukprot:CAMPEP_0177773202 /NCGR_PEP_ID=MMETSP0491_2-20121128/12703_1 /TAXON_ID=63592 /ORGANISM="Tetraselmis chuii, Strain PLY429" /LENGTH=360 /DNA_ID=CAMNT_0019291209 /DNA_START=195 /DNA_END=1277 /DNA_ORIENTATION=+
MATTEPPAAPPVAELNAPGSQEDGKRKRKDSERAVEAAVSAAETAKRQSGVATQLDAAHSTSLLAGLSSLRHNPATCELQVIGADGGPPAPLHRAVALAMAPGVLESRHISAESVDGRTLRVADVSSASIAALVDFLYTGKLKIKSETVKDLKAGAEAMGIEGAVALCGRFLGSSIRVDNVLSRYVMSQPPSGMEGLHQAALEFIDAEFEAVAGTTSWLGLGHAEVCSILQRDSIQVSSEDAVLAALQRWVAADQEQRMPLFLTMFLEPSIVRLPYLSPQQLAELDEDEVLCVDAQAIYRIHNEFKRRVLSVKPTVPARLRAPPHRGVSQLLAAAQASSPLKKKKKAASKQSGARTDMSK